MPKPTCVKCKRFFKPFRNGIRLLEQKPTHPRALSGTVDEKSWVPYKIWMADQWRCDGCGSEIVVGAGANPLAIEHQDKFQGFLNNAGPFVTVNDC